MDTCMFLFHRPIAIVRVIRQSVNNLDKCKIDHFQKRKHICVNVSIHRANRIVKPRLSICVTKIKKKEMRSKIKTMTKKFSKKSHIMATSTIRKFIFYAEGTRNICIHLRRKNKKKKYEKEKIYICCTSFIH